MRAGALVCNNLISGNNADGWQVDITLDSGELLSVDGGQVDSPPLTGYSTTDENGSVVFCITRDSAGPVNVTASAGNDGPCAGQIEDTVQICFSDQIVVGFIYDLCTTYDSIRTRIDDYLTCISTEYPHISYQRITGTPFVIDQSLNTVFLVTPTRDLDQSEIDSLCAFVQSGRNKRVVLVGEYNQTFYTYNLRLNAIATGLGMNARFSVSGDAYDGGYDHDRLCAVSQNHYLMVGVSNLWDAATSSFATGWEAHARPLAYTYQASSLPWILEEDTATTGSRILVHDSDLMHPYYNNDYDTVPDKNFRYIYNLCAAFPQ